VIYSTCSLEPEENEQVIAAAIAEFSDARLVPLESRIDAMLAEGILMPPGAERLQRCLTPEGCLRLLPGMFHTDGFFIAMVEKTV
jgi:16S rRNA (cytosine967-C5)-methyltransferase